MPAGVPPQQQSQLLALPEPLLLAVLRCLAAEDDQCSLFSAARAHSSLRQAAPAVLNSISIGGIRQQQQLESTLLYLGRHGQHVSSLSLRGVRRNELALFQLPPTMQLHSLELHNMQLQLLPGFGSQGVLGHGAGLSALKRLRLKGCALLDGEEGLDEALQLLPTGLEHLSMDDLCLFVYINSVVFPTSILQQRLQQLTHLELWGAALQGAEAASPVLQPLQALSRLADLRLAASHTGQHAVLTASIRSSATGLTRLELNSVDLEAGALAGKTQLQHLDLFQCAASADAWTAQLLSHLAPLQQLSHLGLANTLHSDEAPTAAAYSALTASSKLRHLAISSGTLPEGVWQHMFPAGRQLPHLTSLRAAFVQQSHVGPYITVLEGSRLVSCCPGLRCLDVMALVHTAGAFSPLSALSGLHTLSAQCETGEAVGEVCQLTGLQELDLFVPTLVDDGLLLRLTQLRQLTRLAYNGPLNGRLIDRSWVAKAPGDEPVWRQVLRAHLGHSDPAVVQQAIAALAEA